MSDLGGLGQWHLDQGVACLASRLLGARLDPARVQDGITAVEFEGRALAGLHLLGLRTHEPAPAGLWLESWRVRRRDVVAVYAVDANRHTHVEAVWRVLSAEDFQPSAWPSTAAGLELIVSVYTERLEGRTQLAIESRMPVEGLVGISAACAHDGQSGSGQGMPPGSAQQAQGPPVGVEDQPAPSGSAQDRQRPRGDAGGQQGSPAMRFERLGPRPGAPAPAQAVPAPVCLLYSLRSPAGGEAGYVEAAAPSDVPSAELSWVGSPCAELRVRYPVFPAPLEKGVILRARVRAVFLGNGARAREHERCAAEVYQVLAAADPVLGT